MKESLIRAQTKYAKTHTTMISLKLMNTTDADIIAYLDGKAKQTEIKRLVRLAMEIEKRGNDND